MTLFRVTYVQDSHPFTEYEIHIVCKGLPTYKEILRRIYMKDYCGKEMSEDEYQEFVIGMGNFTKYNIESVEQLDFIKF